MYKIFNGAKLEFFDGTDKQLKQLRDTTITLWYPDSCTKSQCSPYKLTLPRGSYKFECWGSKGAASGIPGLGAYTKGVLNIDFQHTFYIFIGATGFYNAIKDRTSVSTGPQGSGGSTDVRLIATDEWSSTSSLYTRIMVAAGGGSAEWVNSMGGNGGTLKGGQSISASGIETNSPGYPDPCQGATQTSSLDCPSYKFNGVTYTPMKGGFGFAGDPHGKESDGGFGGNGYYGGTSYPTAFAGSGGSSFISGHQGCNAIKDPSLTNNQIVHTGDSIHYSGIKFTDTEMIAGNETMPLPDGTTGIWDEANGAFRITCLILPPHTCDPRHRTISIASLLITITSLISN